MHVTVIPGVGPATAERLRRAGIHTVADLESVSEDELVRLLGNAHGPGSTGWPAPRTTAPVVAERETKSVSVEGTYDTDLTDRRLMEGLLTRQADERGRAAAQARAVRPHRHHQAPAARLHHAQPVDDAALPHRQRGDRSPGWPAPCSPTSTPPAGCGCSASASPAWPTGSRRTCSATTDEDPETDEDLPPDVPTDRRRAWAPGHRRRPRRAWAAGWVWGSGRGRGHGPLRDRGTARPARCGPSPSTTPSSARGRTAMNRTWSPGRSCAHRGTSSGCTTATTG